MRDDIGIDVEAACSCLERPYDECPAHSSALNARTWIHEPQRRWWQVWRRP